MSEFDRAKAINEAIVHGSGYLKVTCTDNDGIDIKYEHIKLEDMFFKDRPAIAIEAIEDSEAVRNKHRMVKNQMIEIRHAIINGFDTDWAERALMDSINFIDSENKDPILAISSVVNYFNADGIEHDRKESCGNCGYRWDAGGYGSHRCDRILKQRLLFDEKDLEALKSEHAEISREAIKNFTEHAINLNPDLDYQGLSSVAEQYAASLGNNEALNTIRGEQDNE